MDKIPAAVAVVGNKLAGGRGLTIVRRGRFRCTLKNVRDVVIVTFHNICRGKHLSTYIRHAKFAHSLESSRCLFGCGKGHVTTVSRNVIIVDTTDPNNIAVGLHEVVNCPVQQVIWKVMQEQGIKSHRSWR